MLRFEPSRFQTAVLHLLLACALIWLLLLTGYKEYWGFWQSPDVYSFLKKSYPQWQRDYVRGIYNLFLFGTLLFYGTWMAFCLRRILKPGSGPPTAAGLATLLALSLLMGAVLGVRGANNLVSWLDQGELHGMTTRQTRE